MGGHAAFCYMSMKIKIILTNRRAIAGVVHPAGKILADGTLHIGSVDKLMLALSAGDALVDVVPDDDKQDKKVVSHAKKKSKARIKR